jgi:hypothetical protein
MDHRDQDLSGGKASDNKSPCGRPITKMQEIECDVSYLKSSGHIKRNIASLLETGAKTN